MDLILILTSFFSISFFFQQIPHIVPDLTDGENYILNLQSTGGLVETTAYRLNFNKNQSVLLVQTDKNIYKPGQNGKLVSLWR